MPEPYWPKRKGSYVLSDASRTGRLILISCRYCKRALIYMPADLSRLLGDIEVDDVADQMTCSGCKRKHTLKAEQLLPSAPERQGMTVRRLEKVYYVRRAIWRDEKA